MDFILSQNVVFDKQQMPQDLQEYFEPAECGHCYVCKLVAVFREVRRVLKDDGTCWIVMGDSYASAWASGRRNIIGNGSRDNRIDRCAGTDLKEKDLIGIPWMVAFALRADGWWLRSDIIWAKPNPMPESVTDRPTKSHEYIFLLAKAQHYYYDAEAIKEPAINEGRIVKASQNGAKNTEGVSGVNNRATAIGFSKHDVLVNGRNKRDVWTVTTKPYKGAHFATFPPDLIEPCILAGSSEKGECPKCGKAWTRILAKETHFEGGSGKAGTAPEDIHGKWEGKQYGKNILLGPVVSSQTLGWQPQCECVDDEDHEGPLIPIPQTVLDPFNGSGTTGEVAIKHGRNYIGCELNPEYIELTNKRLAKIQPILMEI